MGLISSIVTLALFALLAWFYFRRQAQKMALPEGTVVYEDSGKLQLSQALVSQQYGLSGRPDYLIKTVDGLVPVEIKSRQCSDRGPYAGEEAQLLAYCVLVEETFSTSVPYGILQYANRQWGVPYNAGQRQKLLTVVAEMRASERSVDRNHNHAARCAGCGFRAPEVCGQALVSIAS